MPVLNWHKHLEHPKLAEKLRHFLPAGKSVVTQMRAQRIKWVTPLLSTKCFPSHSDNSSDTRGARYEFIVFEGSEGPGITPTNNYDVLSLKSNTPRKVCYCQINHSDRIYSVLVRLSLYGWNQSTFSMKASASRCDKNWVPSYDVNSFQTVPLYMSVISSWLPFNCCLQRLHSTRNSGCFIG